MRHAIHHILPVTAMMIFATASDCSHFGPPTGPNQCYFLTGECLKSNKMEPVNYEFNLGLSTLVLPLRLDWDTQSASFKNRYAVYAILPSENVFNSFADDAKSLKNDFYAEYNRFDFSHSLSSTITVFCKDGIIVTADKEFCSIPAGENLFPTVVQIEDFDYQDLLLDQYQLPRETIPEGCKIIRPAIHCKIHYADSQSFDEEITFHLEVPVKVGLYLHYLKDKRNTADARMQYLDEILSGDFTTTAIIR